MKNATINAVSTPATIETKIAVNGAVSVKLNGGKATLSKVAEIVRDSDANAEFLIRNEFGKIFAMPGYMVGTKTDDETRNNHKAGEIVNHIKFIAKIDYDRDDEIKTVEVDAEEYAVSEDAFNITVEAEIALANKAVEETSATVARFEVGKSYRGKVVGKNQSREFTIQVIKRTAKSIFYPSANGASPFCVKIKCDGTSEFISTGIGHIVKASDVITEPQPPIDDKKADEVNNAPVAEPSENDDAPATFAVGKTYQGAMYDWLGNYPENFKVIKRTAKTITIESQTDGKIKRRSIYCDKYGNEFCNQYGNEFCAQFHPLCAYSPFKDEYAAAVDGNNAPKAEPELTFAQKQAAAVLDFINGATPEFIFDEVTNEKTPRLVRHYEFGGELEVGTGTRVIEFFTDEHSYILDHVTIITNESDGNFKSKTFNFNPPIPQDREPENANTPTNEPAADKTNNTQEATQMTNSKINIIDAAIDTLDDDMKDEVRAEFAPFKDEYAAAVDGIYLDDLTGGPVANPEILPAADMLKIVLPLALTDHSSTAFRKNVNGSFTEDRAAFKRLEQVERKIFTANGHKIGDDNPIDDTPEFIAQDGTTYCVTATDVKITASGNHLLINGVPAAEYADAKTAIAAAKYVQEFNDDIGSPTSLPFKTFNVNDFGTMFDDNDRTPQVDRVITINNEPPEFTFNAARFGKPDDKIIRLAEDVAASMSKVAPDGWAVSYNTVEGKYKVTVAGASVASLDTITVGDFTAPQEFFAQFITPDELSDEERKLNELRRELKAKFPDQKERLQILEEMIHEVRRERNLRAFEDNFNSNPMF